MPYERAGFKQPALRLRDTVRSWRPPHFYAGAAIHSLRADHLLDGVVFASPVRPFARAMVGRRRAGPD